MRKYLGILRIVFLDNLEYPGEILYWLVLALVPLFIMSYMWLTVYKDQHQINGFSLSAMITYYFVTMVVGRLTGHSAFRMADLIKDGQLSALLMKPMGIMRYIFIQSFGGRAINLMTSVPLIIVVYLVVRQYIILPTEIIVYFQFLASVVGSVLIFYSLGFTLGLISFWTLEIGGVFYFYYGLANFLGGGLIPLSFFPEQLKNLLHFLPFNYIYYFPASVYLGHESSVQIWTGLAICFVWIAAINWINIYIFNHGLKRYSSFGN